MRSKMTISREREKKNYFNLHFFSLSLSSYTSLRRDDLKSAGRANNANVYKLNKKK